MPPELHALLSPSSSERWRHCPPSARLEEKLKERFGDKGSPFARRGTKAHALAELKLRKEIGEINDFVFKEMRKELEQSASDLDWKDLDWSTNVYVDHVMSRYYEIKRQCPDAMLLIEQRYDMTKFVPGCFGTSDATIVSDLVLAVMDYKAGLGVPVKAEENPQARLYGVGATLQWQEIYAFDQVENHIIQPGLDSISVEHISKKDLLQWGEELRPIAQLAWEGNGEYDAGDWCRFCAARALCYHRAAKCMTVFDSGMETPGLLPPEEIPRILECADIVESWIKDIRDYARSQALKGQNWPGFKLVAGRRPPRKWVNTDAVVDQLSRAGYGDEQIYKPREIINPGEAEKLLGKPAFRAILGQYTVQGEGAPTLVPESDKRLSINSSESAFADLI